MFAAGRRSCIPKAITARAPVHGALEAQKYLENLEAVATVLRRWRLTASLIDGDACMRKVYQIAQLERSRRPSLKPESRRGPQTSSRAQVDAKGA